MEDVDTQIRQFLSVSYGYGSGYGYGDGSGDGYGYGYGYGSGDGSGDGYGYGYGSGSGDGSGDGYGYGYGSGYGYGDGYGSGYGYGDGSGDGYGDGYGYGLKSYNNIPVYYVDGIPTCFRSIHNNIAEGFIIQKDMTPKLCYIAKCHDFFAHGDTIRDAVEAAKKKYDENKPLSERIADFVKDYPSLKTIVPCSVLFVAHNRLTGSCEFGRRQFCQEKDIDIEHDSMSVAQFIELTQNSYGGDAIKQLKDTYNRVENE